MTPVQYTYSIVLCVVVFLDILIALAMIVEEALLFIFKNDCILYNKIYRVVPILAPLGVASGLVLIVTLIAGAFIL